MKKILVCFFLCLFATGCLFACTPSPSVREKITTPDAVFTDDTAPYQDTPTITEEESAPLTPVEKAPDLADSPLKTSTEDQLKYAVYLSSNTDGLNVRSGAGVQYSVLGTLDKGDMVKYVGEKDGWAETIYRDQKAYVFKKYVEKISIRSADEDTEKVIDTGCNMLGVKYVYGATRLHDGKGDLNKSFSDNAFDCSSLMQYIFYYGKGAIIDVNTRTQVKQGVAVDKNEIKRGDLLFFTNSSRKNKTGIERIGHVALYLGDNYILHTASDHAVIEKISSVRWSYYICARRI